MKHYKPKHVQKKSLFSHSEPRETEETSQSSQPVKASKLPKFPVPGWLFTVFQILYCEILLHLWCMDGFSFPRFAAVAVFALGFGCLVSQAVSFFGCKKWSKGLTIALCFLLTAFTMVEFFVEFSYQTYMPVSTLVSGAKGVATDFADVVIVLVLQQSWRILVVLLPIIAYGLLAQPVPTSWRTRWFTLASSLVAYAAAFAIVFGVGIDADRLSTAYNFDSAVRAMGLNMGMVLETMKGGDSEAAAGDFLIEEPVSVDVPETVPAETEPEETVPQETEPIVYGDNVLEELDFGLLAEEERNSRVAKIHKYVNSLTPSKQNQYTGLFEGKNLILIAAEGFSAEVIDPELTPTLYRLANEGIKFHDYYQPMWGGSTSSGEFSIFSGVVPSGGTNSVRESLQQDLFLTMGNQLQKLGYHSVAYHNHLYTYYDRHKTHEAFGYDEFIGMGNGMEDGVKEGWPESDKEMMEFTVQQYIDKQPFSVYYMTVSGHTPYRYESNKMSRRNREAVEHLDASDAIKAYYACNLELEYGLQYLVEQLEAAGIADDTVIALSADHYPYGLEEWTANKPYIHELYGFKYKNHLERDHNALIIWSGCLEDMDLEVTEPVYSLDILPTLSNLFGLDYDSRLLVGRDVFSDEEAIVLTQNSSWKTVKGVYDADKKKFTPNEGEEVDKEYVERINKIVSNKITYSRELAAVDYFDYVSKALKSARKAAAAATQPTETVPETTEAAAAVSEPTAATEPTT
ncbi:MAG: sulfatase-like hydrolase/transferase [Oscillospiraceae bacterium]|nr:sulfatase-like hydrolase/transferase [Oscillospiraceae bacterium]